MRYIFGWLGNLPWAIRRSAMSEIKLWKNGRSLMLTMSCLSRLSARINWKPHPRRPWFSSLRRKNPGVARNPMDTYALMHCNSTNISGCQTPVTSFRLPRPSLSWQECLHIWPYSRQLWWSLRLIIHLIQHQYAQRGRCLSPAIASKNWKRGLEAYFLTFYLTFLPNHSGLRLSRKTSPLH